MSDQLHTGKGVSDRRYSAHQRITANVPKIRGLLRKPGDYEAEAAAARPTRVCVCVCVCVCVITQEGKLQCRRQKAERRPQHQQQKQGQ